MVELNHTIVWCKDQKRSSAFLAEMRCLAAVGRQGEPIAIIGDWNRFRLGFGFNFGFSAPNGCECHSAPPLVAHRTHRR